MNKPAHIVFLDFDGVLHPEVCPTAQLFSCLPLFEGVLLSHADVEVVISSSWRLHHPLTELRNRFSLEIADRIVDGTPVYRQDPGGAAVAHVRERECRAWLDLHRPTHPWVAIDDVPWLFTPGCPHLLLTSHRTGFTAANAAHLHTVLERMSP